MTKEELKQWEIDIAYKEIKELKDKLGIVACFAEYNLKRSDISKLLVGTLEKLEVMTDD